MSEYKRLTKKDENTGKISLECTKCPHYIPNRSWCCEYNASCIQTAKDRLYELEEKIENGTLLELPCKVGDTTWYIFDFGSVDGECISIDKGIITGIFIQQNDIQIECYYENGVRALHCLKGNQRLFFDKAEAEHKLAELKGEY